MDLIKSIVKFHKRDFMGAFTVEPGCGVKKKNYPRFVVHDKDPVSLETELHFLTPDAIAFLQL